MAWGSRGLAVAVWLLAAGGAKAVVAMTPDAWPAEVPEWDGRDNAGGIALLPLLCWWVWIAFWAATSDWVFRDSTRHKIRPEFWTLCVVFPFVFTSLLAWWIPWSAAGQAVMAIAWVLPLLIYSRERNPKLPAAESILTAGHMQRWFAGLLKTMGVKVKSAAVSGNGLPWVTMAATSAETPEENKKWQEEAAAMPGFAAATKLLQEAAAARASMLVIEATADGVRVGHDVDGISGPARGVTTPPKGRGKSKQPEVWENAPPLDATIGSNAVAVLRTIAGADAAKLSGEPDAGFMIEVDGKKRRCRLVTRSTKTTKQVSVNLDLPSFAPKKLEDLGMSAALGGRVRELISLEKGLFVISSPAGAGCSTTFDAVLVSADRLLRDFVSIEESATVCHEVQNVKPVRYSAAAGEKPVSALKQAMLEYPRAVVTRDLSDKELALELLKLADDQQLVIVSVRATDALDAIQKLLQMDIPADLLARCFLGSLSQRLIRKLCPQCGEPLPTPLEILQKLRVTAEELPEIKRASSHGGCRACAGRQYVGRTAIYEVAAGPTVRQAIAKQVDSKVLRQAAVKDGMRTLIDEGLGIVAAGISSLEEMQRVFAVKKEAAASMPASAKPGAAKPLARPGIPPNAKPSPKPGSPPRSPPGPPPPGPPPPGSTPGAKR